MNPAKQDKIHMDIAGSVHKLVHNSAIPFSDKVQGLLLGQLHNLEVAIEANTKATEEAARKADHFATVLLIVGSMTLIVALIQLYAMVTS